MRTILELMSELRSRNFAVTTDGQTLKVNAPSGALTPELRAELSARKPEILEFLRSYQASTRNAPMPAVDRSRRLPLSPAQQRLWFLNQLAPESPVYNICVALEIDGVLDREAMDQALWELLARHEALRTSFRQEDGVPYAVVGDAAGWELERIPLDRSGDLQQQITTWVAYANNRIFDLSRGPLLRAYLLETGPNSVISVFVVHHIVFDGWSLGILVREFAEIYRAYVEKRSPVLAPLDVQYVDYAAWQAERIASGEIERQLPFWKKYLAGAPPLTGFPADRKLPENETFAAGRFKLVLPSDLVVRLEALSQAQGVTLFMTLLAAFSILLGRYANQQDVVVGTPSAGRSRSELDPLIGLFVNNLVLRTDLTGNPRFTELLQRVKESTLRVYENQDVPFDVLVQTLRPERTLGHSPLFQVMFALQSFPLEEVKLPGLVARPLQLHLGAARFDVSVEVYPKDGELHALLDFKTDLYDRSTILQIGEHFRATLQAVVDAPTQPIDSIDLLTSDERQKLLIDWNQTQAPVPPGRFDLAITAQARRMPDKVAVVAGERSLTYAELDALSNRVAAAIAARGAGPGALVAICLPRSVELVAALLAVAKSGAAYVPLDPAYPPKRIAAIFEDAQPVAVLTSHSLRAILQSAVVGDATAIFVEDLPPNAACASLPEATADDLAYVIFTSGSTGRPKGVALTHRSLMNFLASMQWSPGMASGDVLLAVTTPSFDIAALELLLPLYCGATVCVAQEPGNPAALLQDLARYRPSVMQATPATWKLLIAAGWKGDGRIRVLCGGEALDTDLARSLLVRSGELWNMYGPTETTIWSAALCITAVANRAIPVGRPIANTSFYVLDAARNPVPVGVAGELWIGGEGVARGYLNRPDLTAERFIESPFPPPAPGWTAQHLYRTGDLVRFRSDGTLDFLGRIDHQVKFRGYRIELGEIEAALRAAPGVADAVVLLRDDDGEKRLCAYVLAPGDAAPSVEAMRDFVRTAVPEYMVPSAFLTLPEFPRLPNGKLDRAALPRPEQTAGADAAPEAAPETNLQKTIADVLGKAIGVQRVSLDQNFFDLGAHSLQIVRIHAELSRVLERKIPLISFFQYPTLRALSRFIQESTAEQPWPVAGHSGTA